MQPSPEYTMGHRDATPSYKGKVIYTCWTLVSITYKSQPITPISGRSGRRTLTMSNCISPLEKLMRFSIP